MRKRSNTQTHRQSGKQRLVMVGRSRNKEQSLLIEGIRNLKNILFNCKRDLGVRLERCAKWHINRLGPGNVNWNRQSAKLWLIKRSFLHASSLWLMPSTAHVILLCLNKTHWIIWTILPLFRRSLKNLNILLACILVVIAVDVGNDDLGIHVHLVRI